MVKKKYQISELRESDNDYQTRRRINENFKQLFSMAEDASKTGGSSVVSDSRTTVSAGCILPFTGTEAPNGFLMCDGSLYPIIDYPELFESIGYTYGGVGEMFAVPDLNGRTLIGSNELYPLGSTGGEAEVTLSVDEMPSHTHTATSYYDDANYNTGTIPTDMGKFSLPYDSGTITRTHQFNDTGGDQPHNNMQPYLAINYIICCSSESLPSKLPSSGDSSSGEIVTIALGPGYICPFAGSEIPRNFLLCDGSTVSRYDYPELFNAIGTMYGGEEPYFKLPDLQDRVIMGAGVREAGTSVDSGLPNIEGTVYPLDDQMANYSGAFSSGGSFAYDATSTSSGGGWKLKFDASMSNDIYGASDIVQPPAVIINYIICYKSMASGGDGLTVNPIPTSWIEAL